MKIKYSNNKSLWLKQLYALIIKEFKGIVKDPSSWLMTIILPFIFLLLFGYGISLDAGILNIGVVNNSNSAQAQRLYNDFLHSSSFKVLTNNWKEGEILFRDGLINGIVIIDENFGVDLAKGQAAKIQILVDGSDPNTANFIQGYVQGVISNGLKSLYTSSTKTLSIIDVEMRYWYNPSAESKLFLVPGSITIIMTLIGTLLTSLVIAREWERGTMEAIFATPVSRLQLLLGKFIPYFCMGLFSMLICTFCAVILFDIPFRGSILVLLLISAIFMCATLGQGLLISVLCKTQLPAAQAGLFSGFLPALILSGFVFDINSMPLPLQIISHLIPASYYNSCLQTIFLTGNIWEIFIPSMLSMLGIAFVLLGLVYINLTKKLN